MKIWKIAKFLMNDRLNSSSRGFSTNTKQERRCRLQAGSVENGKSELVIITRISLRQIYKFSL